MRRLATIAALLVAGCATALKEPPPLAALQQERSGAPPARLLEAAAEAYARRPDAGMVRRAESLCLEAAQADESSVDGLVCAIRAKAWLAQRETDGAARTDLAVSAVQSGQWCLKRAPASAACRYWLAVGLGLQAREKPATAEDGLKRMAALLREAAAADPALDDAGPQRVLAVLLVRAPGWPLGPGDSEEGLVQAQKAVLLRPFHPPNQLALGDAYRKNGSPAEARSAYLLAGRLARSPQGSADPDAPAWAAEADEKAAAARE